MRVPGNHRPSELSGGELQRVAMARALTNNPKIVLAYVLSGLMQLQQQDTVFQGSKAQRMIANLVFSPEWTAIAFAFAIIVSTIFGLYPTRKAAKLDLVEALRYE